jgi:hypothetical protein
MTDIPPPDDVLEQHQEVFPEEDGDDRPTSDPEAPEADALEQAQVVPPDDDDMRE